MTTKSTTQSTYMRDRIDETVRTLDNLLEGMETTVASAHLPDDFDMRVGKSWWWPARREARQRIRDLDGLQGEIRNALHDLKRELGILTDDDSARLDARGFGPNSIESMLQDPRLDLGPKPPQRPDMQALIAEIRQRSRALSDELGTAAN